MQENNVNQSITHLPERLQKRESSEPPFIELFYRLRKAEVPISIEDYQSLIISLQSGFGLNSKQEFRSLCITLWIKSKDEERVFDKIFFQYIEKVWSEFREDYSDLLNYSKQEEKTGKFVSFWTRINKPTYKITSILFVAALCLFLLIPKTPNDSQIEPADFSTPSLEETNDKEEISQPAISLTTLLKLAGIVLLSLFLIHIIIEEMNSYASNSKIKNDEGADEQSSKHLKTENKVIIKREETSLIVFANDDSKQQRSILGLLETIQKKKFSVHNDQYNYLHTKSSYERLNLRQMKQAWRYLRQPIREGVETELDIPKTVAEVAKQGVFLKPVFKPHRINRAEVILLLDWGGSMLPFHSIADDLIKTASRSGGFNKLKIYYFKDCPKHEVFIDKYFIKAIPFTKCLKGMNYAQSSMIVFSDAGAARGSVSTQRLSDTKEFIAQSRRTVRYISWLNPMPQNRWFSTSAEQINDSLVPMFEATYFGMQNVINVAKGKSRLRF